MWINGLSGGGGWQLWTPAAISTELWLDAADPATITLVSGAVSQWNDKSGNARHATQGTAGSRPVVSSAAQNGLDVITFDGSDDFMDVGSVSSFNFLHKSGLTGSVFVIAKVGTAADPNAAYCLLGNGGLLQTSAGFGILCDDRASVPRDRVLFTQISKGTVGAVATNLSGNGVFTFNQYEIFECFVDPSNATAANRSINRVNGGAEIKNNSITDTPTTNDAGAVMRLAQHPTGTAFTMPGNFCEVVFMSSIASTDIRERMEGYYAHKWGTTANLPGGHTYKTQAPTL